MTIDTKKSKLQKLWEYMRRNRTFTVGEANAIFEINHTTLRGFLYALEVAGYIVLQEKRKGKDFLYKSYKLIEDTGEIAPSFNPIFLIDHNINKKFIIARNKEEEEFFSEIEAMLEHLGIYTKELGEYLQRLKDERK